MKVLFDSVVVDTQHIVDRSSGTVTVEIVAFMPDASSKVVSASAKATKGDPFDEMVGYQLAYGRAFRQLGRTLLAEGHNTVHQQDHSRRLQKEASDEVVKRRKAATAKYKKELSKPTKPKKGK